MKSNMVKDDTIVAFENVSKHFQLDDGTVQVLRNINFSIKRGSFTIVFGPSGSGKSTLLNVLTGLEPPSEGTVMVDGTYIYTLDPDHRAAFRARTIGMVYQTNFWIDSLTAQENVALPLYLTGRSRPEAMSEAQASIARVGMEQYARYRPNLLSGGQQQRISMARASIISPVLLVADEPTGNLDSKNGDFIIDLVKSFKDDFRSTVILVTHNADYLPLSDHRLYIKDGVVTQENGPYKPSQQSLEQNLIASKQTNHVTKDMDIVAKKTTSEAK